MSAEKWAIGIVLALAIGAGGAGAYYWTPGGHFDPAAARKAADAYDARILRDSFGVPHIHGKRNADVAFGLAYAHAEDDWINIEQVIRSNRGKLAEINGKDAAQSDYLILSLGNTQMVEKEYDTKTSPDAKAIAEGYAAGANLWCAENPKSGCARTAPITGKDIIAGYANRPPFFYGLDGELNGLLSGKNSIEMSHKSAHQAYLGATDDIELGSNGIAVAPSRASDGHTRLAVNSHQPYTGTVAWYEARLKSEEGLDMIGGVFPGSPLILHGAGPNLGWASTVNKPDLFDTFLLTVDDPKKPTKYKMDGLWKPLTIEPINVRVKVWGPFSRPVTRTGYWSEHGPVYVTDRGVFAVSFASAGEFHYLDQYLAMNTAKTLADWRAAQIKYNAIPSVNYTVADSQGHIAYFYNAHMAKRVEGWDRHKVLPGDTSETLWKGYESPETLPAVINPTSGWVENSNNTPFEASSPEDNPKPANYPASYGIETNMTNRAMRAHELFGTNPKISRDDFIAYKMDHVYSVNSNVRKMVADLVAKGDGGDADAKAALGLIATWDGSADTANRAAGLSILTGQKAMGGQINGIYDHAKALAALKATAALLKQRYGRIDPEWSDVSRIQRGDQSWPTNGGPDTLRAVYANGDLTKDKFLHGTAGDTYVAIADWAPDGSYTIDTIHQFGSATVDASSPHYADQSPLFAAQKFKRPPMTLDDEVKQATRDYRPGKPAKP